MFSSAELIEALRRRARRSIRPERPPGTFPEGWSAWFASLSQRVGAVTGATVGAIIQISQREPARRHPRIWNSTAGNVKPCGAAMASPAARRWMRWLAIVITAFITDPDQHLLWRPISAHWGASRAPEGSDVVEVEFIAKARR